MAKGAMKETGQRIIRHFSRDVWTKDLDGLGLWRRRAVAASRLVYMVFSGFVADHCIIRASALTFITILSIVPFLAVAFSISKGFGLQNAEFFRDFLMGVAAGRAEVVDRILQYIANTNVKTLGWIGVATLLVTVFTTVGNVERAFNTIWAVKKGRTSWRKFTDFFSIIVICPIIVLVAASFTVAVQKLEVVQFFFKNPAYDPLEKLLLKSLSLALVWLGFTFAYAFIPNTRVRLKAAAAGGVIAGTLWQTAQWAYINWQIGFTKYNAIYGSFAQLPLFLVWLYISWMLVLLGAEIAYAWQHLDSHVRRGLADGLSPRSRQKVAVLAMTHMAARFLAGAQPHTLGQMAVALRLPEESLADALEALCAAGLAVPLHLGEDEQGYALAVDPGTIRMAEVAGAVLVCGNSEACAEVLDAAERAEGLLAELARAASESAANRTLAQFAGDEVERVRIEERRMRLAGAGNQ